MLIDPGPHDIQELEVDGRKPFSEWFHRLRDKNAKAAILARLDRIAETGNFGDYRHLSGGVFELRVHMGPGYRVYFGLKRRRVILLLLGGDKSGQVRDFGKAMRLWTRYKKECDA